MEWKIHAKGVCYSSEAAGAGQHHLPWKVDVCAVHKPKAIICNHAHWWKSNKASKGVRTSFWSLLPIITISSWPSMQKHKSSVLNIKACTAADTHIETLSGIHWTPALILTLTFLTWILWKIWLWTVITICRKPTYRSGRTILQGEAEGGGGYSGSVQWLFLCSHLAIFHCCPFCFFLRIFLHRSTQR